MKFLLLLLFALTFAGQAAPQPDNATRLQHAPLKSESKQVQLQRYLANLEVSLHQATQWAVHEPNTEALWIRVKQTLSNHLENEWRAGRLLGTTPEHAFFVTCDRSTMTQADIDNNRLVCQIGVAPVKPAEFTLLQIRHTTGVIQNTGSLKHSLPVRPHKLP